MKRLIRKRGEPVRSFWIWFLFLVLSWLCAFVPVLQHVDPDPLPWRLGSSAIFFTGFFLAPLYRARPAMLFVTLLATSVFSVISLWPASTAATNPYVIGEEGCRELAESEFICSTDFSAWLIAAHRVLCMGIGINLMERRHV
ncbi:hypothetical protein [Paenibacillus lautus]|jgi:hypothetical protein